MINWKVIAPCALFAALLAACGGDPGGPTIRPRSFAMGFTDFPYDQSAQAVSDVRTIIRQDGDLIVQHFDAGVPWQEAAAGTAYDPAFEAELNDLVAALPVGHQVLLTVTPINFLRDGLALRRGATTVMPLTPPWDTLAFDDTLVIRAFTAYAEEMIQRFHPDYFGFAIEANLLADKAPAKWPAFRTLAESVYVSLKRSHPALPVFATIQAEALLTEQTTQGPIFFDLLPVCDIVALSSYPSVLSSDPTALPANYFTGIAALAPGKPFAISETGWPAEPITAPYPAVIPGSEAAQAAYVRRLFSDLDRVDTRFVNWFISRDYDSLWVHLLVGQPGQEINRFWKDHGLYAGDGAPRPALAAWRVVLARPRQ